MSRPPLPVPLTHGGVVALVLGALCYVAGWWFGWIELFVVAAGCAVALALAAPFVLGRLRLDVARELSPSRVIAGEPAMAVVTVSNDRRAISRPAVVEDQVDGKRIRIEVPSLPRGEEHPTFFRLPTTYRGRVTVGPAVLSRRDPLHLMRRDIVQVGTQELWVHPRHTVVAALPVGFAKDLEGPTSDTSPVGDVAFHTLRDYQPGDDYRHIHWMSTARHNKPVVRHYVDNRRPQLLIVIDDRPDALPDIRPAAGERPLDLDRDPVQVDEPPASLFDRAVEAAAALAVSALLRQEPVAVWNTHGPIYGARQPGGREDLLDRLTVAAPEAGGDPLQATLLGLRTEPGVSAVVLLTGPLPPDDLVSFAKQVRRSAHPVIGRVWPRGEVIPGSVPGARVIDYDTLAGFCQAWGGLAR